MTAGVISSIGLLVDIIGAFFLAESFVLKRRDQTLREARDYYDGNPHRLRSAVLQAWEARVGFTCLFMGFGAQFVSVTDWVRAGSNTSPGLFILGGLLVFGVLLLVVRVASRRASRRAVATEWGDAIERNLGSERPNDLSRFEDLCLFYGQALDLRRSSEEDIDTFGARIVETLRSWKG